MARELTAEQIESFRTAFDTFDDEKVGSVSRAAVTEIFEILEVPFNAEDLDKLMKELDVNNSGRLEFEEFAKLIARFVE